MLSINKNRDLENTTKVLLGVVFLVCGCFIYLLFRSKTLYIYIWSESLGFSKFIDPLRCLVQEWQVNNFIKFSLPDGLYCAAYILIIDVIWHDDKRIIKYIILSLVPIISILSEFLQYFGIVQGTFDVMDLFCFILPLLFYMSINYINNYLTKK